MLIVRLERAITSKNHYNQFDFLTIIKEVYDPFC